MVDQGHLQTAACSVVVVLDAVHVLAQEDWQHCLTRIPMVLEDQTVHDSPTKTLEAD